MDDEYEWDGEVVDLDVTGNPAEDIAGYESPRRRGQNLTGFTSSGGDYGAASREGRQRRQERRAAVQANIAETKRRNAGRVVSHRAEVGTPAQAQPDLAPHVSQAVAEGMAGRDLGMWRVDVRPDGSAQWTRVAVAAPGYPTIAVEQVRPRRRWWHRRRPEEPQPSPGTRVW